MTDEELDAFEQEIVATQPIEIVAMLYPRTPWIDPERYREDRVRCAEAVQAKIDQGAGD